MEPPGAEGSALVPLLRSPLLASPDSLSGQVRWIRDHWAHLLPDHLVAAARRLEEATGYRRGAWPAGVPVIFTAHSIPERMAASSPYVDQIRASCQGVARILELGDWELAYQSRSGPPQVPWLEQLADRAGTKRILVLGDMNAWRLEDPIRRFRELGLVDLVERLSGLPQHSFLYWGQTGTLDYAFASESLAAKARRAVIWNINASWPGGMDLPEPWLRMADHDPVVVDFDFSHSSTSD